MITVDQAALGRSIAKFNQAVALRISVTHEAAHDVLRDEAGRLNETMMRFTPPASVAKTRDNITERVGKKFGSLGTGTAHDFSDYSPGVKAGSGNVRWYAFEPHAIYGIKAENDKTGASVEDLYQLYFSTKLNKQGRIVAGQRGKQTVYLWQQIKTKASTVAKLTKRLRGHVGRAKAGWLKAYRRLQSQGFSSSYSPPKYITDHENGQERGFFVDGLGAPGGPTFSIGNTAKGIGSAKMRQIATDAMRIRAEAIPKRLQYLIRHPELIKR
jgi:hypothetical protein